MNWKILTNKEHHEVWERFNSDFQFKPSIVSGPPIKTDLPTLKFNISVVIDETYPDHYFNRFHELGLKLLLEVSQPDERIYALDWQHNCFDFDPRFGMRETEVFTPSFIPDGDYYIFITKDFANVWFGHPWEQSITLIGKNITKVGLKLISEFEKIGVMIYK